jgi:hypothetical protein
MLIWIPAVLLFLSACGGDDNGEGDTLLTGLSGVVILAIVVWLIVRSMRKRS